MVESLYGVEHGAAALLTEEEITVRYSLDLLQRLVSLPPGASVGIEYAKELGAERPDGISFGNIRYWQALENLCEDLDLHPVYLDDPESYERLIKLFKKKNLLTKKLERHLQRDGNPQKTRELREALFGIKAEKNYITRVEREDKIIGNILKHQPRVAIVGHYHGDLIMLDLEELRTLGLTVGAYFQESLDPNSKLPFLAGISEVRTILQPGIPDPRSLREKETTIRQYYAAKLGRVLPGQKPDFIGTWNPGCRPEGLFEMYVERRSGQEFGGIIEDTTGTASFRGIMTANLMEFTKNYDPERSFNGLRGDIEYAGNLNEGVFYGFFQPDRLRYPNMEACPFYLNAGDKLKESELVLDPYNP